MWNSVAQKMNPSQIHLLRSKDKFSEVDDPKGHLKKMLSSTMLNGFRKVGIPDHELLLKVDDICLVTPLPTIQGYVLLTYISTVWKY